MSSEQAVVKCLARRNLISKVGSASSYSAVSEGLTRYLFVFCQAGIIEEMLEDTFESLEDQEEMEEEAEMEIDKILFEITAGECACARLPRAEPCCPRSIQ